MSFNQHRKTLPTTKAIALFGIFGCLVMAISLINRLWGDWPIHQLLMVLTTALCLIFLLDWRWAKAMPPVTIERQLTSGLALNRWSDATLIIHHQFAQTTQLRLYDDLPSFIKAEGQLASVHLHPHQTTQHTYRLRPLQRGPLQLTCCHVRLSSPLGLWQVQYQSPSLSEAKIYPDFAAISAYTLLATENQVSQVGIRRKSRRGQGLDFHQLREYRKGDSLRQLDWKATARRQELISKEYQDERDQNIVLMIDSGRRMRSKDDELDHFDHALNASLLISYIALRQGDSVGVLSFGHSERWIPPQKGGNRVNTILNGLYDLQTSNRAPDYLAAAEKLIHLQRKRSLVILVTNTRDEELDELTLAITLLRKHHVVLVANIREAVLDLTLHKTVNNVDDAMAYCGTIDFLNQRQKVHKMLLSKGIYALDCQAKELPVQLANSYWDIKRAGAL